MRFPFLLSLFLLCNPHSLFAWGELGHRAIGEAVQASLDPDTREAIAHILNPGQPLADGTLAQLSVWPDQIRNPQNLPLDDQPAAREFNRAHPFNRGWHFVNLPLGAPGYPDLATLASENPLRKFVRHDQEKGDIVQKITDVIAMLETQGETTGWTKPQALAWLLHLVQDLHQPLHVSSGYFKLGSGNVPRLPLLRTPAAAAQKHVACDRGGNQLVFETSPHENLHSLWDNCLPQLEAGLTCTAQSGLPGVATLAETIKTSIQGPTALQFQPTGDHHGWAAQWATDSLQVARTSKAYEVTLTNPRTMGALVKKLTGEPCGEKGQKILLSISAPTVMNKYVADLQPVAAEQLTKAAIRLAALLRQIQWK